MGPSNIVEVVEIVRNLDILVEGHVTAPVHPEVAVHVITLVYLHHRHVFHTEVQLSQLPARLENKN